MTLTVPRWLKSLRSVLCAFAAATVAGCSAGYYLQAARGQLDVSGRSEPVDELLAADIDERLRERLVLSQAALDFAHTELGLPDNGSYRSYADLERPYIVWNVFAAPEFELSPRRWCFPIAGCVAYRGYFKEADARAYAQKIQADGYDVFVGGVRAYSTLGRLRDPLLNTMLPMSDDSFAGLLFHELAHQQLYVQDDTAFNEAFATVVEQTGIRRWRKALGQVHPASRSAGPGQQVRALLLDYRRQLKSLYASDLSDSEKRAQKMLLLVELTERYAELTRAYGSRAPYRTLFAAGINNAALIALSTYANRVPAFEALLQRCDADLPCFYTEAEKLSRLDKRERDAALDALAR